MQKPKTMPDDYTPTYVTLDYLALKECMKDAIKEALLYERRRRERAIFLYVFFMIVFGALFVGANVGGFLSYRSFDTMSNIRLISGLGLGATQIVFSIWALTRWI